MKQVVQDMKNTVTEKAYNYIRDAILNNVYPMGAPISEMEIAGKLGISRSPIREAFRQLEVEGILKSYSGRGTFVITMSLQDLDEIFELRLILELRAFEKAFKYLDQNEILALKKKIEALDTNKIDPVAFYDADKAFHELFINKCGNHRLISMYKQLMLQIAIVRRISSKDQTHFTKAKKYHLDILELLLQKDEDGAKALLGAHIRNVQESTKKALLVG